MCTFFGLIVISIFYKLFLGCLLRLLEQKSVRKRIDLKDFVVIYCLLLPVAAETSSLHSPRLVQLPYRPPSRSKTRTIAKAKHHLKPTHQRQSAALRVIHINSKFATDQMRQYLLATRRDTKKYRGFGGIHSQYHDALGIDIG